MPDRSNVALFPVTQWAGVAPATVARRMLDAEARDGFDARCEVLKAAIRRVNQIVQPLRLPHDVRRAGVGEWVGAVFAAEHHLRRRQDRTG